MIPVARDRASQSAGRYLGFLGRRARRILPPYYAALALSLLMIIMAPGMGQASGEGRYRDNTLPALEPGAIMAHLLLVHNWGDAWATKIDPPMPSSPPEPGETPRGEGGATGRIPRAPLGRGGVYFYSHSVHCG